jgi:hypothetical protein
MRLALLLLALSLTACTTAQIDVPEGWLPVEGANPRIWNQPISFGEWRTSSVREGAQRSLLLDAGVLQLGKTDQAYRLTLNEVDVECHTRELVIGRGGFFIGPDAGETPLLTCGYLRGDAGAGAGLLLMRTGRVEPALRGELRVIDGLRMELRSVHRAKGGSIASSEPFGYEIVHNDKVVAIVETINQGRVWIDPAAKDRDFLAAAAASLLLFRDPNAGD